MLTDEQLKDVLGPFPYYSHEWGEDDFFNFARAIEKLVREATLEEAAAMCDERQAIELAKAKAAGPYEPMYVQNAAQNRLMAQELRELKRG
jgi:hypothetical protein